MDSTPNSKFPKKDGLIASRTLPSIKAANATIHNKAPNRRADPRLARASAKAHTQAVVRRRHVCHQARPGEDGRVGARRDALPAPCQTGSRPPPPCAQAAMGGAAAALQSGQSLLERSQGARHSRWNSCLQANAAAGRVDSLGPFSGPVLADSARGQPGDLAGRKAGGNLNANAKGTAGVGEEGLTTRTKPVTHHMVLSWPPPDASAPYGAGARREGSGSTPRPCGWRTRSSPHTRPPALPPLRRACLPAVAAASPSAVPAPSRRSHAPHGGPDPEMPRPAPATCRAAPALPPGASCRARTACQTRGAGKGRAAQTGRRPKAEIGPRGQLPRAPGHRRRRRGAAPTRPRTARALRRL
eukprot:scaffold13307_cov97-Isochrysis_galbana.AAC.12